MDIKISEHFTAKKLLKFTMPSICMMVFNSVYGVVDGFFVSNYAGKTAFAAVNLVLPFMMLISTFGFMIGSGGSALVSKNLGEGKHKKANQIFSMLVAFVIITGVLITIISQLLLKRVVLFLGADDAMLGYCMVYGRITLISVTFFMLQNTFQSFFITAEKPKMGLYTTVFAGLANMILDFLFVGVFKWGVTGASVATMISEILGGGVPLIYFMSKNNSLLRLTVAKIEISPLIKACTNGVSELMSNASTSIVNMLYNYQLIRFFGEDGIAAYGVIMYVNFVFVSVFIGYSIAITPIVGFNYGAENKKELNNVLRKSLVFSTGFGVIMLVSAVLLATTLSRLFVGYDFTLMRLTRLAFILTSTRYVFAGLNVFGTAFFTGLNNGAVSGALSFLRTLVFQSAAIFILPAMFGKNAIWLSITVAEVLTLALFVYFLITKNKKYNYIIKQKV